MRKKSKATSFPSVGGGGNQKQPEAFLDIDATGVCAELGTDRAVSLFEHVLASIDDIATAANARIQVCIRCGIPQGRNPTFACDDFIIHSTGIAASASHARWFWAGELGGTNQVEALHACLSQQVFDEGWPATTEGEASLQYIEKLCANLEGEVKRAMGGQAR